MSIALKSLAASTVMLSAPVSDAHKPERETSPNHGQVGPARAPQFTLTGGAETRMLICVGPARLLVGGAGPAVLTFGGEGCGERPYAPMGVRLVAATHA